MRSQLLKLGLIINPWAGLGGEVALKGSDGFEIQRLALEKGAKPKAEHRVRVFLEALKVARKELIFYTYPGKMGASVLEDLGYEYCLLDSKACESWVVDEASGLPRTSAEDTARAADLAANEGVEVLLFAGGDGTARDIVQGLESHPRQACLGIPCGVKIQSAVYGRSPQASADILLDYLTGGSVSVTEEEVRDIDEAGLREGLLGSTRFGALWVLHSGEKQALLQSGKEGAGQYAGDTEEKEALVHEEMSAFVLEHLEISPDGDLVIVGAGKTTSALKRQLGNEGTLLGVDVFFNGELIGKDATEAQIFDLLEKYGTDHRCLMIVSVIGGQGFVFGRGNQQLSSRIIRKILAGGDENLWILATESKLASLKTGRLLVDTGDRELDALLSGSRMVLSNYDSYQLCRIES